MIYVLLLICGEAIPVHDCTTKTARAYHAIAEQGAVCGLPYQNRLTTSPLAPNEKEYILTQCRAKR